MGDITSIVTWMLAEAIPEAELFMHLLHSTKIPKLLQPLSPWDSDKSWHSWSFTPELKNVVSIPFIARAKAATARHYRLNVKVDRTPGNIHNTVKINFQRPEVLEFIKLIPFALIMKANTMISAKKC